jgi:hypothetical protein
VALPFILKKYLNAKEELWKFKYFTMQKYNLQKNLVKETKILQDIITLWLKVCNEQHQNVCMGTSRATHIGPGKWGR